MFAAKAGAKKVIGVSAILREREEEEGTDTVVWGFLPGRHVQHY